MKIINIGCQLKSEIDGGFISNHKNYKNKGNKYNIIELHLLLKNKMSIKDKSKYFSK